MSTWHCRDLLGFPAVSSGLIPITVDYVCVVLGRPGSDIGEQDGEQCTYTGEQLSPVGAGYWDGSLAVGDWKATQSIPLSRCQERVIPCCANALFNPSKSCQASGLVLPTRLCLKKFTLIDKPHFCLSSFTPNRTSLFTARNAFPSLVFMLCEYL